jgi:hypothetical protein
MLSQVLPFKDVEDLLRCFCLQQAQRKVLSGGLAGVNLLLLIVFQFLKHLISCDPVHLILFISTRLSKHVLVLLWSLPIVIG